MADYSLPARITTVTALKAADELAAVEQRVFSRVPDVGTPWPYLRYGRPTVRPFNGTCLAGCEIDITIHAFAEGETDDDCSALAAAVVAALDGRVLSLADTPSPARLHFRWTNSQVLSDIAKADGWHGIVTFTGTVTA